MKAVELKKDIYWVGGIDWDLRNFHGYLTQRGSTYNAYLIMDEEITLIDTVKTYLYDEMIERIASITDPSTIKNLVINHVEMDHSGALPKFIQDYPDVKIYASPQGVKGLKAHFGDDITIAPLTQGDSLNLGSRKLDIFLTPMVHWPDNMVNYLEKDGILFSNDSFGQHIATSERFEDDFHADIVVEEARKYFANIVLPYTDQVKKELDAVAGLSFDMIAPSHGLIWRSETERIIELYRHWSENRTEKKALIIYDTMWNSTRLMAKQIQEAFDESGYRTMLLSLQNNHISDIMTELITAEYVCVGSPTLNNNMLPTVAAFLTYLKGLAPKGRKGIAFGSYGWGGQSIEHVREMMENARINVTNTFKQQYIPSAEDLAGIKKEILDEINA